MTLFLAILLTAQHPPPNWEMTLPGARQFGRDVCSEADPTDDPDDPAENAACYAAYLRQQAINRAEELADRAYRRRLCRAERAAAREGLIGTAPQPGEEGISESNPTPTCRRSRR